MEKPTSDQDLADLVFSPQFSTKSQVTDISGRGMGMSAVQEIF